MTERQAEFIRWLIKFFFVYLFAAILSHIAAPVLDWLTTVAYDVVRMTRLPPNASTIANVAAGLTGIALKYAAGAFAYAWLMKEHWKPAAAKSWALFTVIQYSLFWPGIVIGAVASVYGARWHEEEKYNQRLRDVRDALFDRLGL
ncbi:MAG: hypothetical protein M0D55_18810 [Elusimicrobiota bacterium]|nr:MAG: hypothetical protein M0D55_18810 [Elusimicrobiota bacterium]